MNLKQIKELLQKYYAGETSLEEEKLLVDYFEKGSNSEYLKAEQIQFRFYQNARKESTDKIYQINTKPNRPKVISLNPILKTIAGIAAIVVLIFSGVYFLNQEQSEDEASRLAYLKTKKALLLVSTKLNKGTKNLHQISKLNKVQDIISSKKQ